MSSSCQTGNNYQFSSCSAKFKFCNLLRFLKFPSQEKFKILHQILSHVCIIENFPHSHLKKTKNLSSKSMAMDIFSPTAPHFMPCCFDHNRADFPSVIIQPRKLETYSQNPNTQCPCHAVPTKKYLYHSSNCH